MKMKTLLMIVPLLALSLFFLSCGNQKETKEKPEEGVNNTLVSDLALRALLQQSSDPQSCALAARMSDVVHSEMNSRILAEPSAMRICCCPCDDSDTTAYESSSIDKIKVSTFSSVTSVKLLQDGLADHAGGNNCPCPSIYAWIMAARQRAKVTIVIDDIMFEKQKDDVAGWETFKLGDNSGIKPGDHILKITGDFLGEDSVRVYNLPIVVGEDGKPYMK